MDVHILCHMSRGLPVLQPLEISQTRGEKMDNGSDSVRHYSGDAIEITYDPHRCIHSAECLRGLPAVFDSSRKPWIIASEAEPDEIARVVARCPSGALHYKRRDGGAAESPDLPTTIVPTAGGPLHVRGLVQLRSADGSAVFVDSRMALCRCGQSRNRPFCDNSHVYAGFDDSGAVSCSVTPRKE
jgi:uncharacterized Fe-S cluster protein YjdI/CDGSH-type Zn-finger protein